MNHADLIDKLGGGRKVHQLLRQTPGAPKIGEDAVYVWKTKASIPSDYWPAIATIARAQGVPATIEDLARGSPRRKPHAKRRRAA